MLLLDQFLVLAPITLHEEKDSFPHIHLLFEPVNSLQKETRDGLSLS